MSESMSTKDELLNWDIDRYLNPIIPHNRIYILPKPISRWLGYRTSPTKEPAAALQWPITFLATVAGLCLAGGIGNYGPEVAKYHPPILIASLGASAILEFSTIKSPLSQPRNAVIGNTLSALMGVCASKLFQLNPDFHHIQWVSGAVGCAMASLIMSITGTIHPPGGATAVLASVDVHAIGMGWMYIPVIILDSVLIQIVALIFNNLFRQFPVYWWSPAKVGRQLREEKREKRAEEGQAGGKTEQENKDKKDAPRRNNSNAHSESSSDITLRREATNCLEFSPDFRDVQITSSTIQLPQHLKLSDQETLVLEKIQHRIRAQQASQQ